MQALSQVLLCAHGKETLVHLSILLGLLSGGILPVAAFIIIKKEMIKARLVGPQ